ncbi:MAG: DUF4314 domain-containing protein [Lachnospiraceae bacterium]|nr:DUF4314 domain-containing protein [Butyrivibrio sp.]MCM1411540.1 DUF4314 domain-containing protein [Lachnospiraceae bacterium]
MGIYIRKEELDALREKYPKGCHVELVKMDDPYREMPPGLKGVVTGVDDTGSIHVNWENGSTLAVVYKCKTSLRMSKRTKMKKGEKS